MDDRCIDCSNVPKGETCVCKDCGNQFFDKWDCCICEEPCKKFDDMQERARKERNNGKN